MSAKSLPEQTGKRKTIQEIYIVRTLAIIGVLMVHSTSQVTVDLERDSILYPVYNFLNIFFKFGTPTFIFLSAFVLFYSYLGREISFPLLKRFYTNRIKFILIPYILFSAAYFFPLAIHYNYYGTDYAEMFAQFWDRLKNGKAYAHLYFVFISIQFYVLFPFLLWLMQKKRSLLKHAIWIGFVVQWTFFLLNHYFGIYEKFTDIPKGSLAVSYFSYYMMGAFMGVYYEKFLEWMRRGWKYALWALWLLAAGLHVYIFYLQRVDKIYSDTKWYELYWNLHTFLSALVLFYFAFWLYKVLPQRANKILINLGICSFGIYLFHPAILLVYRNVFMPAGGGKEYHMMAALGFVLALGLSWLVVYIASKVKGSWIIFGQFPKPKKSASAKVKSGSDHQKQS